MTCNLIFENEPVALSAGDRTMRRIKWKDTPHEKIFWAVVIAVALLSILVFATRVAGI